MQNSADRQRFEEDERADGPRESTETDAGPIDEMEERRDVAKKQIEVPAVVRREDDVYKMTHPRRGAALIFNHKNFANMAPRNGSEKDVEVLTKTFQQLGFETRIHTDLTHQRFFDELEKVSEEDHGNCDCLVVTVMSHGDPGYIHCYDTAYAADKLWEKFTADNCPSLAGKPKLFFIQACRGERTDVGIRMRLRATQTDSSSAHYTLPTCADILVAYSTVQGFYSWRDPTHGSWFIQALCEELDMNGRTQDLLAILTSVCRRVAIDYQSYVPGNQYMDLKKQIPAFTSMLTRRVLFG